MPKIVHSIKHNPQIIEIVTSSGKQLNRSLRFKKRGRPKKNEGDNAEWSGTATILAINICQVQEILHNAKHSEYHIWEENSRTLSIVQQIMFDKVISLEQPRYPANLFLCKANLAKKGEKLRKYFLKFCF